MAEDEVKSETKTPLKDPERARKSIESAISRGTWPQRKSQEEHNPQIEKAFPTKEEQEKELAKAPFSIDTIPPSIKRELTEEAKMMNTMAMGEGPQEKTETPQTPPLKDSRDEGVARFKEILKQGATPQETLVSTPAPPAKKKPFPIPPSQRPYVKPAPENLVSMSTRPPLPEEKLRQEINQTPLPQKESFINRFWNKLTGRG